MKDQQKLCKILWRFDGGLLAQSVNNLDIDKMWFGYHGDAVDYDYCVETMETEAFFVDNNIDVSNIKIPKAMQQIFEDNLPQYLEQFSRSTLYKIHGEERAKAHFINILKWYIKKIDTISIQWVLFSIVPHFGIDQILSDYLKWKGCRVFYAMQTLFPNLLRIYEDYNADLYPIRFPPKELILPMPDCEAEEMFYMKKNKKKEWRDKPDRAKWFRQWVKSRLGFKKYPKEKIDRRIAGEKAYWNNMQSFGHWDEKKLEKAVGYGKFIYYPLHLQPEMTTSVMGGDYKDQMLSIEHLSRILPKGWKIVVKENPKQYYDYYYRGDEFFKRMHSIDNLIFVGKNIDTKWLIKKSCIVATITGTAGWESIRLKRPVLTFGDAWYDGFPGVYKFNPKLNLKEISEEKINPDSIRKHFESWLKNCWVGIVDSDYEMISERSEAVMQQDLMEIFNDLDEITAFKDHRATQTLRK